MSSWRFLIKSILLLGFFSMEINYCYNVSISTNENFGPYNYIQKSFSLCRGPKRKNVTSVIMEVDPNLKWVRYNMTFLKQASLNEVRIVYYSFNEANQGKKLLFASKFDQPCKHIALGMLIRSLLKTPDCTIKKGNYIFTIQFEETFRKVVGTSFFYGDYFVITHTTSKEGNLWSTCGHWSLVKLNIRK